MPGLTSEQIAALLKKDDERKQPVTYDSPDEPEETFFCQHCGNCKDPDHCVWGVQCPLCFAPPHELCLDGRGAKTGLHQERWDYAGTSWRV